MSAKKKIQVNSKRALCLILVALLFVFAAFFVAGISARFIDNDSADKSANIAKWAVVLKDGDGPLSQTFSIDFTAKNNPHVAPNKFAPSSELQATLVLDLTGTDVAADYNVTVDTRVFGNKIQSGDIALTVFDNGSPIVLGRETCVPLSGEKVHAFTFVLSWKADGDDRSDADFAFNNLSVSLPVSVRVRQHLEDDEDGTADDRKISSAISYKETSASKPRAVGAEILAEQDILSDNPESGFYSTSFIKLTESGTAASRAATSVKSNTSSMLNLKVDLSEFSGNMNASGEDKELTAAAVNALNNTLESIKQNDNTVILRFVYDNSATGEIANKPKIEPEQTMLLKHIEQLGNTFKAYATTINAIQVGFYGLWGECYYNSDAVKNGATYYPQTVNALLNVTSGTEITVAVRAVQYYNWYRYRYDDNGKVIQDCAHADDARVGIFNDAYGANATDMGTYSDRAKDTDWLGSRSAHTYYGGEAIPDSDATATNGVGTYNSPDYFIKEAYKLHTSYLNWEWNQAIHKQWAKLSYTGASENDNALAYIESHLGYRFVVKDVKTYKTVTAGETVPIDIAIRNSGFANLVKSKRCDIVFVNSSGAVAAEFTDVGIDAKKFISQATVTQSVKIQLPSTLAQGSYGVYLRMSSGQILNSGKYYSAVRFANEDMWNDGLQANYIAGVEVGSR